MRRMNPISLYHHSQASMPNIDSSCCKVSATINFFSTQQDRSVDLTKPRAYSSKADFREARSRDDPASIRYLIIHSLKKCPQRLYSGHVTIVIMDLIYGPTIPIVRTVVIRDAASVRLKQHDTSTRYTTKYEPLIGESWIRKEVLLSARADVNEGEDGKDPKNVLDKFIFYNQAGLTCKIYQRWIKHFPQWLGWTSHTTPLQYGLISSH